MECGFRARKLAKSMYSEGDSMRYVVTCECGRTLAVQAGDAGAQTICTCGSSVAIPSLSVLRKSAEPDPNAETSRQLLNPVFQFGVLFATVLIVGFISRLYLLPPGVLLVLLARVWFALLVFLK